MLRTANLFQDRMVLQREQRVPVWGMARPGARVSVSVQGSAAEAVADPAGRWQVTLGPLDAARGETLLVESEGERLEIRDVAVGEVWLAGGQSNMEFFMRYDRDLKQAMAGCENPDIRFYDVPETAYEGEEADFDYSQFGFWRPCDPENLQYFSAVGYYFAARVYAALHVPVGILGCNWGGTRAVCWMDEDSAARAASPWLEDYAAGLKKLPDPETCLEEYRRNPMNDRAHPFDIPIADRMMYGVSPEELAQILREAFGEGTPADVPIGPCHEWRPCGLYHTMLEKTAPYGVRGVLWYQGESDAAHADIYEGVLAELITCWRRLWNAPELPFILTQLAPLSEIYDPTAAAYPALRQAQQRVSERLERVWCTTAGDVGCVHDIHPKVKEPIGRRMALLALHYIYGQEELPCEAPLAVECRRTTEGIAVRFLHGEGLRRTDREPLPLELRLDGEILREGSGLEIDVEDGALRVRCAPAKLAAAKTLGMGDTPYYDMNLSNQAGIPAKPFTFAL